MIKVRIKWYLLSFSIILIIYLYCCTGGTGTRINWVSNNDIRICTSNPCEPNARTSSRSKCSVSVFLTLFSLCVHIKHVKAVFLEIYEYLAVTANGTRRGSTESLSQVTVTCFQNLHCILSGSDVSTREQMKLSYLPGLQLK